MAPSTSIGADGVTREHGGSASVQPVSVVVVVDAGSISSG